MHRAWTPRSNGGLVLMSSDGRIVCGNTVDDRIMIAYHANLPDIRARLFGVLEKGGCRLGLGCGCLACGMCVTTVRGLPRRLGIPRTAVFSHSSG